MALAALSKLQLTPIENVWFTVVKVFIIQKWTDRQEKRKMRLPKSESERAQKAVWLICICKFHFTLFGSLWSFSKLKIHSSKWVKEGAKESGSPSGAVKSTNKEKAVRKVDMIWQEWKSLAQTVTVKWFCNGAERGWCDSAQIKLH